MPKKGLNVSLQSYDDIFSTEETRQDAQLEKVQQIPLGELHPFKNHPFKVIDDEAMLRTVESIAQFGVLSPAIARPRPVPSVFLDLSPLTNLPFNSFSPYSIGCAETFIISKYTLLLEVQIAVTFPLSMSSESCVTYAIFI